MMLHGLLALVEVGVLQLRVVEAIGAKHDHLVIALVVLTIVLAIGLLDRPVRLVHLGLVDL